MHVLPSLARWSIALCLFVSIGSAAHAQEAPAGQGAAATRVVAKNFADKQCFVYGNAKATFAADGDQPILRVQYGSADGLYGGAWFPIKPASKQSEECRGLALVAKGTGAVPGQAYVVIRNSTGGSYRSKNVASLFAQTEWQETLLTAGDFIINPETKPDVAKSMPKEPDWTTIARVDLSAVHVDAEPLLEVKSLHYVFGGPAVVAAPAQAAKPAATSATGAIPAKNLADKQCFSYGNVKPAFATDAGKPILRLAFGTGDGMFGGAWFPIPAPKIQTEQCRGILLSVRGNGNRPGRAYLFIRNGQNGTYRSKEITSAFAATEWTDLLLTADDFIPDPDSKAEVTRNLPKKPDFSTVERMDFSAVNLEAEPVLEIRSIAFDMGAGGTTQQQPTTKAAAGDEPPADLKFLPNAGPLTPTPKKVDFPQGTWYQRHKGFVARARQGDVDLLWLGDSITDNWNKFKGTYRELYPDVKAANFAIGGDGTQNVLWRLENGELDGITPKVAVLLIGTNNVQWNESDQIAEAIGRIVSLIRSKSPTTKVLLLAIFPRGDLAADSPGPRRIKEVNAAIAKLDDGKNVRYLDISAKLSNPDGTILQEAFADKVHLSQKGFTIWANAMQPLLDEMMK